VEELFHGALDAAPGLRAELVRAGAGGDGDLEKEVLALLAADADAEVFLGVEHRQGVAGLLLAGELPRRLGPYRLLEVAGQGGMGLVYRAERADGAFDQRVAVKMLRPGPTTEHLLSRFDAERRVLARLEHPGIARVLDAGEDERGAPWLAMEFVDGTPIDDFCDARTLGIDARIRLFVDVLAAVSHAHEQLVVHRDLKPDNILVDGEGRPRLLDFGIAKVLELSAADDSFATRVEERALTPAYASPEQVLGQPIGPRSDVYALGVVLYELLCACRPYRVPTATRMQLERAIADADVLLPSAALQRAANADAIARARGTRPAALRRRLRGDLDRIVAMALRREPARRYASAADLADDLARFLAGLPVRARGDGALYRLRKLVQRRPMESALVLMLAVGATASGALFVRQRFIEAEQLATIERLADSQRLLDLHADARTLVPVGPDLIGALEAWLARADTLLARRALHRRTRDALRAEGPSIDAEERTWRGWQAARLDDLLGGLAELERDDPHGRTRAGIAARLARARSLARRSIDAARDDWDAARARVGADPRFRGFGLDPVLGLVPLGVDPDGGLEAFWALDTGVRPARDDADRFEPSPAMGLVLLLVPPGQFSMGAQALDPTAPNYSAAAEPDEAPVHTVPLQPFLISKFEVTQGQWVSWTGNNPADYAPGGQAGGHAFGLDHPIEQVSWLAAREALAPFALDLPTEAQWEYAARAGAATPWSSGADERALAGFANFADRHAANHGGASAWNYSDWADDGHTVHAPVGSFAPNPWGLCDVHGNVWEWVRDAEAPYTTAPRVGDGLRGVLAEPYTEASRVLARGGGFFNPPSALRSSERYLMRPDQATRSLGFRPVRALPDATAPR